MSLDSLILEVSAILHEIARSLDASPESIDPKTSLFELGLGLDSVDLLELIVVLDKRYGLKIKNDEGGRQILRNVESIAQAIFANNPTARA